MTCAKPSFPLLGVAAIMAAAATHVKEIPQPFIPLLDRIHHAVVCIRGPSAVSRKNELHLVQHSKWRSLS
jgi:hypothetical protein